MPLVVDSSALVEVLTASAAAPEVRRVMKGEDLFAPELVDAECLAAIGRLERRGWISSSVAVAAVEQLIKVPIERISHIGLVAVAWSLRANLSLYDALYVSLALRLNSPIVTADGRMAGSPNVGVTMTLVPRVDRTTR